MVQGPTPAASRCSGTCECGLSPWQSLSCVFKHAPAAVQMMIDSVRDNSVHRDIAWPLMMLTLQAELVEPVVGPVAVRRLGFLLVALDHHASLLPRVFRTFARIAARHHVAQTVVRSV